MLNIFHLNDVKHSWLAVLVIKSVLRAGDGLREERLGVVRRTKCRCLGLPWATEAA